MSLAIWSTLFDEVLPEVSGCPQPVAVSAIRRAVIDFCQESFIYSQILDPVDIVADQRRYAFSAPADTDICAVLNLSINGVPYDPIPPDTAAATIPAWMQSDGSVRGYMEVEPGAVDLFPAPADDLAQGLQVRVALKPTYTADGVEAWLLNKYRYELAEGAKHFLMMMPGRPYSNPTMADFYGRRFFNAKTDAKAAANRGVARAGMRVQFRKT